jgi:hypothetical protein
MLSFSDSPISGRHLQLARSYHGVTNRGMITDMKVDKISISLEAELGDEVRTAALKAGIGVSAWLAGAAAAKLRAEALAEFIDAWERKHGPVTVKELSRAESELGLKRKKSTD